MTSGRERPLQLADQFRNGNLSAVAAEVACDGPTALAVAAILDAGELARLRRALDDHLDQADRGRSAAPAGSMRVGGEARGGPVLIPLRGIVR
jgi:hypothetical protein